MALSCQIFAWQREINRFLTCMIEKGEYEGFQGFVPLELKENHDFTMLLIKKFVGHQQKILRHALENSFEMLVKGFLPRAIVLLPLKDIWKKFLNYQEYTEKHLLEQSGHFISIDGDNDLKNSLLMENFAFENLQFTLDLCNFKQKSRVEKKTILKSMGTEMPSKIIAAIGAYSYQMSCESLEEVIKIFEFGEEISSSIKDFQEALSKLAQISILREQDSTSYFRYDQSCRRKKKYLEKAIKRWLDSKD